jgi:hypothetical protein
MTEQSKRIVREWRRRMVKIIEFRPDLDMSDLHNTIAAAVGEPKLKPKKEEPKPKPKPNK